MRVVGNRGIHRGQDPLTALSLLLACTVWQKVNERGGVMTTHHVTFAASSTSFNQ